PADVALPAADAPVPVDIPIAPLPDHRPAATATALIAGTVLGSLEFDFDAEAATSYLAAVNETSPLYAEERIAHPGWLLQAANAILASNVRLGPWIHTGSTVVHAGIVHDGDRLVARGRTTEVFERGGHRFVVL